MAKTLVEGMGMETLGGFMKSVAKRVWGDRGCLLPWKIFGRIYAVVFTSRDLPHQSSRNEVLKKDESVRGNRGHCLGLSAVNAIEDLSSVLLSFGTRMASSAFHLLTLLRIGLSKLSTLEIAGWRMYMNSLLFFCCCFIIGGKLLYSVVLVTLLLFWGKKIDLSRG